MALINNTHLNLKYMTDAELHNAIGHAEIRVRNALDDIEKLSGEIACRQTVEIDPVQLQIPSLEQTRHLRY